MESYIQYAAGYSKDNVTPSDIKRAILDIQKMDEEHGAFWVSVFNDFENILEIDKSLNITAIFDPDNDNGTKYKAKDWQEIESFLLLLIDEKFDDLKQKINKNWH
jgi:hypothetical protein